VAGLHAQSTFPTLTGETIEGTSVQLPAAGAGKYVIVAMAYSQKAGPVLEEWYAPAYTRFIAKHGLFASTYEAELYFVPMFVGLDKAAYEPSMKKLRKSADPDVARRVVFFKGESEPIIASLDMKRKDTPYFFVLDPQGRVIHREEGAFSEEKMEAMEEAIME
jgi:hypothetical protein